ncbi:MAG: hypothetical protein KKE02_10530 [Alphaproteobacteria bacterium]|nr:hypothetical protein [Alphaproteobacteria bacterium]MBU1515870.1 hypothetical protein [Alphaproteobacteria bacterium]MBU2094092.1 hypothetical protein [Alphaproteobacteria bacterium]MBU2151444.1 hypothetical protein [Alphaproteobacteria bacterium]MBU2305280.1 hypothetical protein [Alphaproteobacteria bacterium]
MALTRKVLPIFEGTGNVRFAGYDGPAQYKISGDPSTLREGHTRLRGAVSLTAELAEQAFRAGEGVLVLDEGASFRIVMLGHTAGGSEVFVELRV